MSLFRPDIDRIAGYMPGEQPQEAGWIKLNTNENPYPPSPRAIEAIESALRGRMNIYPDPLAKRFCQAAAKLFDLEPDWFLPANGSDENLTILMRSFVDPHETVAYPYPSYILYETLADLQGARCRRLTLNPDYSFDHAATWPIVEQTKLVFVPNPNSPTGNRWSDVDLLRLVPPNGVLVLDEAYGDFADAPHRGEILQSPLGSQIVCTRSFSKSYSFAGLRFGFAIAHPDLIRGMQKVKDSYNCDTLSLAGATAALEDQPWMQENARKIRATRARLAAALRSLGFDVVDSQSNFVWATRSAGGHKEIYEALKARRILIRYMKFPGVPWAPGELLDGLRVSVGTDAEIDGLLDALKAIV